MATPNASNLALTTAASGPKRKSHKMAPKRLISSDQPEIFIEESSQFPNLSRDSTPTFDELCCTGGQHTLESMLCKKIRQGEESNNEDDANPDYDKENAGLAAVQLMALHNPIGGIVTSFINKGRVNNIVKVDMAANSNAYEISSLYDFDMPWKLYQGHIRHTGEKWFPNTGDLSAYNIFDSCFERNTKQLRIGDEKLAASLKLIIDKAAIRAYGSSAEASVNPYAYGAYDNFFSFSKGFQIFDCHDNPI